MSLEMSRWLIIACGLIFFGFFGFADEARKHYRLAAQFVSKRVGYSTGSTTLGFPTIPGCVFISLSLDSL